ncbi:Fc.00g015330.m01.CDS01 [Cosmosporella sp. VM-42]
MATSSTKSTLNENGIPPFESLPLRKEDPHLSAWGLYGDNDGLGTLNRLTDERVAAAARSELRTGARISMNWPFDAQSKGAFFERAVFHQDMHVKLGLTCNDDIWTMNPQSSTQWDGLRHFGYCKEKKFYGGTTMKDIYAVDENGKKSTVLGIQNLLKDWQEKGVVGRGVLIDLHSWYEEQGIEYDPFAKTAIPLKHLKACLAAQGTEIKFGDILITRTGFMVAHAAKPDADLETLRHTEPHTFGGIDPSEETLKWIWENFSAVAGDQPAFEWYPFEIGNSMHEIVLAGWGCPIGELFDLEALAEKCKQEKRWSFFLTSEVCNVPGGIASPPNALAIF